MSKKGPPMPDDELELLRSVLACAHEERQPFTLRFVEAVKASIGPRKPIIESLNLVERKKEESSGHGL
jgi:hypothetical protein